MTETAQLALSFPPLTAWGGEDFLIADSNREAVTWIERWPAWPGPTLAVHGPAGCGKTHLLRIFAGRCGVPLLDTAALDEIPPAGLRGDSAAAVLDNAEQALAAAGDVAFLHLLNWAGETGASLMLATRRPPARWAVRLPDLRSRLNAMPAVGIGAPDDTLIRAVVVKQLADRGLKADDDVLSFMLKRMERSFAAARTLVERLDAASLRAKRPLTIPFVRSILAAPDCDT